ncbi:hypothetical protein [Microlunatus parietis]|uniref:Uncharacterized protein n=1 Tax=Microlunatus parietis TaxID=682979 RepID=A0A7Y9L8T5_9ACTN|nr:hypothetical protein [Microlunatus parietis]NYE68807.1 hypothetical protein [Microlunatus parietis]
MTSVVGLLDSWSKERADAWRSEIAASLGAEPDAWLAVVGAGELNRDRWWLVLSWVEQTASLIATTRRAELVELSAFALSLLEDGPVDGREAWLIGSVVRCGTKHAGLDFLPLIAAGCARAGDRGEQCLRWLSKASDRLPSTHREVGEGPTFRFERKLTEFDEQAFIRRLKGT